MASKLYSVLSEQGWASLSDEVPALFALHAGHVKFVLSMLPNPYGNNSKSFYAWSGGQRHKEVTLPYSSPIPSNERSRLYDVEVYGMENAAWAGGGISTSLTFQVSSLTESNIQLYETAYIIMLDRAAPTERWWYLYQIDRTNDIISGTYRAIVVYDLAPFLWRVMPPVLGSYPYPDYRFI